MRLAVPAAVAAAAFWACASGYTKGTFVPGDGGLIGPPIGIAPGDGGLDAGDGGHADGGDAGPDGGCAPLTLSGVPAVDGCFGSAPTTATGTVNVGNCSLEISLGTATGPCLGVVSGASDAFDGGCEGAFYACTAPALPGSLTCVHGATTCVIKICDAGTSCP